MLVSKKEIEKKRKVKAVLGFTDSDDYQEQIKKANEVDNKKSRIQGVEIDLTKPYRYWQLLEFCIHKYVKRKPKIRQAIGLFKTDNNKKMCVLGLTNYHIFDNAYDIENQTDRVEKRYEDLIFTTEISKCPYCDDFTLDSATVSKNNKSEAIRYDRQTNKLGNFIMHLNDKHQLSFQKILNIIKKYNY